jgi:hypothetical protein
MMNLIVRTQTQLVLSPNQIHQVQMRVKEMTDIGSGRGETKGNVMLHQRQHHHSKLSSMVYLYNPVIRVPSIFVRLLNIFDSL